MASVNPLLVINEESEGMRLEVVEIASDNIPETLNGETGFHIYHVRMLTELMLREIGNVTDKYSLTEEDIRCMSIASSLHDIGKRRIPESILNFPGKLSPIEYDIVKKHTVFGNEMLDEISSDILTKKS